MKKLFLLLAIFLTCSNTVLATDLLIETDLTWKATKQATVGWTDTLYNDAAWQPARGPTRGRCDFYPDPIFFSMPIWALIPLEKETVYFRKVFTIEDRVQKATLKVGFDDDGDAYINGQLVLSDNSGRTEKTALEADVTSLLVRGQNNISLRVTDSFGGCQWAQASLSIDSVDGTFLEVPLLKQSDPRWGNLEFDHTILSKAFCGSTIRDCGCPLVSMAMVLLYHGVTKGPDGKETNPENLNNYFIQGAQCNENGCISQGYVFGNIRWDAANRYSKEAHDAFGTPKVQFVSSEKFDPAVVRKDITEGKPVILKSPNTSHWFVGTGIIGDTFTINDPLFNRIQLDDPAYGNASAGIRRYEKVNSDFSLIEAYVKTPGNLMLVDMYGRRTGYDPASDTVLKEIPGSNYSFESDVSSTTNQTNGLMWLYVPMPEEGSYMIYSFNTENDFALYVSDRGGNEIFSLETETAHIYYSPEKIESTTPNPTSLQACVIYRAYGRRNS